MKVEGLVLTHQPLSLSLRRLSRIVTDIFILDSTISTLEGSSFEGMNLGLHTIAIKHSSHFPEILVTGTQTVKEDIAQHLRRREILLQTSGLLQMNLQTPVDLLILITR
jgi:hypothetical protein